MPAHLREVAWIYEAMAQRGFGQAEVDEMELWVIARVLGLHRSHDRPLTVADHRAEAARLNAERVRAAAGLAPEPKHTPTGPYLSDEQVTSTLDALRAARRAREAS